MKDASQYPITTPFGQVAGYPLNNGFHNGVDRAMPTGTPVIVNGTQIGLSGSTGASTGPHLHIGRFVGGKATDPNGYGFSLTNPVVFDTGSDATNGNYVRLTDGGDGALWVYLHLSVISVTKGQKLGGNMEPALTAQDINNIYPLLTGQKPTPLTYNYKNWHDFIYGVVTSGEFHSYISRPNPAVDKKIVQDYIDKNCV